MTKKKRPRLKSGDKVKVVRVPRAYKRHLGRVGKVFGVRRQLRMWQVRFKGGDCPEFFRHELKLVKGKLR